MTLSFRIVFLLLGLVALGLATVGVPAQRVNLLALGLFLWLLAVIVS